MTKDPRFWKYYRLHFAASLLFIAASVYVVHACGQHPIVFVATTCDSALMLPIWLAGLALPNHSPYFYLSLIPFNSFLYASLIYLVLTRLRRPPAPDASPKSDVDEDAWPPTPTPPPGEV